MGVTPLGRRGSLILNLLLGTAVPLRPLGIEFALGAVEKTARKVDQQSINRCQPPLESVVAHGGGNSHKKADGRSDERLRNTGGHSGQRGVALGGNFVE